MTAMGGGGRSVGSRSAPDLTAGRLPAGPGGLTPREDQILGLMGLGLTNREIGGRLGVAEKTVKNTVTTVFAKLGVQRRAQAVIYATVRRMSAGEPGALPIT